jgi:ribulose-bisphosphate carboxylase large chain
VSRDGEQMPGGERKHREDVSTSNPPMAYSGDRFVVVYRIVAAEQDVRRRAEEICTEQTVEFPADLIADRAILDHVVGRIETIDRIAEEASEVTIGYAVETSGFELPQLLNVVFGNVSLMPGIRVQRLELPDALLASFSGPRFGRSGLRQRLNVPDRPLLCAALKPMGLSPDDLAALAHRFALGGIDLIKDDHGLADQPFARFRERVERCAEAVAKANARTGRRCAYLPNVTGPADALVERASFARDVGAGGLLIAPGLAGFDAMRLLAGDERLDLPIMAHPAFLGSFVTGPNSGISHYALFGQICRLAGADAVVFPSYGGRFAFTPEECRQIADGTATPMAGIKPSMPTPGGGMTIGRVPELCQFYGPDVILLIGGGLHQYGPDLTANCRAFHDLIRHST